MFGQKEILNLARSIVEAGVYGRLAFGLERSPARSPAVLYAGQAPGPEARPTGGQVKLVHLAKRFPESGTEGNLLYLITSVLPRGAVAWARAARRKGLKVVLNQNGVAFPAWASPEECERINRRNRLLIENADLVVYQSRFCVEGVRRWVGAQPRRSAILPNYVDTSQFKPARGSVHRPFRLVVMGSHLRKERIRLPIEALALLLKQGVDARLRLAGRFLWPDAEREMQGWVDASGTAERVEIHGPYSQAEAVAHYQNSEILLHLLDKDASPTVPLEAMACGLPVVCLRSGGMPELVTPEAGALIPVVQTWEEYRYPSPQEVADAVKEVIGRYPSASQAARRHAERRFSKETWIQRHEELFADVLG